MSGLGNLGEEFAQLGREVDGSSVDYLVAASECATSVDDAAVKEATTSVDIPGNIGLPAVDRLAALVEGSTVGVVVDGSGAIRAGLGNVPPSGGLVNACRLAGGSCFRGGGQGWSGRDAIVGNRRDERAIGRIVRLGDRGQGVDLALFPRLTQNVLPDHQRRAVEIEQAGVDFGVVHNDAGRGRVGKERGEGIA